MQITQTIPIFRIFDYEKAIAFYIDWLGFEKIWEHQFEPGTPVYMEIEKWGLRLHLSEHHGDGSPANRVFVWCTGLKDFHSVLLEKKYKYNRPGISETFYGALCMEVIDPFGNKILFNEKIES